jgi:hypothetical protein
MLSRRIGRTWLLAALLVCTIGSRADAQQQMAQFRTFSGDRIRLGAYAHYSAATCKTASIPKVTVDRKPSGGKIEIVAAPYILRSATHDGRTNCVGKQIEGVNVFYTASDKWQGTDVAEYRVIYPATCKNCKNGSVKATIAVEQMGRAVAPAAAPSSAPSSTPRPEISNKSVLTPSATPAQRDERGFAIPPPPPTGRDLEPLFAK